MRPARSRCSERPFSGWPKWLLPLGVVFSVLFFDAWLSNESWKNDYEYNQLLSQHAALVAESRAVKAAAAGFEHHDRVEMEAELLGLADPNPEQIRLVQYRPEEVSPPFPEPFVMANIVPASIDVDMGSPTSPAEAAPPDNPAPEQAVELAQAIAAPQEAAMVSEGEGEALPVPDSGERVFVALSADVSDGIDEPASEIAVSLAVVADSLAAPADPVPANPSRLPRTESHRVPVLLDIPADGPKAAALLDESIDDLLGRI